MASHLFVSLSRDQAIGLLEEVFAGCTGSGRTAVAALVGALSTSSDTSAWTPTLAETLALYPRGSPATSSGGSSPGASCQAAPPSSPRRWGARGAAARHALLVHKVRRPCGMGCGPSRWFPRDPSGPGAHCRACRW